ncbi:DUF349 domain-containing protein [Colwelliaceae bacterium 6471]
MILSKLFKPKWQHKDVNVRIAAINEQLSVSDNEQHKILLSLIEDDESELVRRAALLKLNNFNDWLAASNSNSNQKIKEYARSQVSQILQNRHTLRLTVQEKKAYLNTQDKNSTIEAWLQTETDTEIVIALYNKIAKPQLLTSLFTQKQNPEIQSYFVEITEDKSLLEKWYKKAVDETVAQLITDKLENIKAFEQKPLAVRKQVQLLLAKLLALKDISDYEIMVNKKAVLEEEWSGLISDISIYLPDEQAEFQSKYQNISAQLAKLFATKAEEYNQLQIERAVMRQKEQVSEILDLAIEEIHQSLATAIFESMEVDENVYKDKFATLTDMVATSVLNDQEKQAYFAKIKSQEKRLGQLPIIAESVTAATHLISKISQLAVPTSIDELNERLPLYDSWREQWKTVERNAEGVLPDSIVDAYKEITSQWKKALQPLFSKQKDLFNQTQKKFGELKRLIASGKYNACFGVFKKVQHLFEQLADHQQAKLQREFDTLSEKMAELSDWEHYIATPRKQQLLTDIEQIVNQPFDNPNEQAQKVKQFRKNWNSLGHADDELDKALNEQFNQLCEQAFAPCRIYYAEQEQLREQHLAVRLSIIDDASKLVAEKDHADIDWKAVDGQLNKLNHRWQDAGEVDRVKYKELNQQYLEILKPLKVAIKAFHEQNVLKKRALIAEAEAELNNEDVFTAIDKVKTLQAQWRNIGYSGPKEENKLWQKFRVVNDALFKKRDEFKAEIHSQRTEQQAQFEAQLAELKQGISGESQDAELNDIKSKANELLATILHHKPVNKSVAQAVESFIEEINTFIDEHKLKAQQNNWRLIFSLLEQISLGKVSLDKLATNEEFSQLSPYWQKKLQESCAKTATSLRASKTLELEIQAGIDSPKEFTQQRLEVQINLMQEKMVSGATIDLQEAFLSWLNSGRFVAKDLPLINRIKPIFC